jgi:CHAT domain-containing protein
MESAQSKQHQFDRETDKTTPAAEQLSAEIFSELSLANEHFSQALRIEATLTDAVFNQAICLERLGLLDPALRSWEKYLELDPNGGWREEAQERIEALKKQKQKVMFDQERIFREFLAASESGVEADIWQAFLAGSQMRGNLITERLLDQYLELLSQGNRAEAGKRLDLLTTAGRIEAEKSGDLQTRDLASFYRTLRIQQVGPISSARRTMNEGIERSRKSRQEGMVLCRQAHEKFLQAGNKIDAAASNLTIGILLTRVSDYAAARKIAEPIAQYARHKKYLSLQVRSLHLLADLNYSQNALAQGVRYSNSALIAAGSRNDWGIRVGIFGFLAYAYWALGFRDQSLNYSLQALRISSGRPTEPEMLWSTYRQAADSLNSVSRLHTSLLFEEEALQQAVMMKRPHLISRSYGFLSETLVKLNRRPEAIRFAKKDLEIGDLYASDSMGEDIKAHALLRLGHLFRETGQMAESRQAYNECIKISESRKIHYERLDAHRGRLLLYLAQSDYLSAQTELDKAIELFEQNRTLVEDDDLKTNFFETGHDIYNLGIELAVSSKQDYRQAFRYSEQARARSLRDLLQAASRRSPQTPVRVLPGDPLDSPQIRNRIPASAQVVQYSCLNDYLYFWVISSTEFFGNRQAVRLEDLTRMVNEYLECIKDPNRERQTDWLAKALFDILIKPLERRLDPDKEVYIVADKPFHQLPFGALIERTTGKYLVEKFVIAYSPSTTVFLHCTGAAKQKAGAPVERCLSVGESVFRQFDLKDSSLPSTKKEAEQIAFHYGRNARVLLDSLATEPMVREAMKNAEIIHIATHGLINEKRSEYSSLALWEEDTTETPDADGMMYASEISRLNLPFTRLAVLSACQTLIGRHYQGEGMMGLGRAFLAAGVPLVVASLWNVDSPTTAIFMDRFHAHRTKVGMTTAKAIRETQREMLKNDSVAIRHPSAWAGFILVGGSAWY